MLKENPINLKELLKKNRYLFATAKALQAGIREYDRLAGGYGKAKRAKSSIEAYLKSHTVRKLQIGAEGNFLKGWLNTDLEPDSSEVVFLDATKPFPFENNSFDFIFSEHMIEHISYHQGLFMLRECYRILKPGGKIRIATPSLETLLDLHKPKTSLQERYIKWLTDLPEVKCYSPCLVINKNVRSYGHEFIYDYVTLKNSMETVGFIDIRQAIPGESSDENLQGLECHGKVIGDEEINRFETMVLEGRRSS